MSRKLPGCPVCDADIELNCQQDWMIFGEDEARYWFCYSGNHSGLIVRQTYNYNMFVTRATLYDAVYEASHPNQ
jgi:hypothetical protein